MNNSEKLKSILLVDDDEASNFLHSIFINKLDLGVDINFALNGQEALDFILGKSQAQLKMPCMVMLDLEMPVMNGWRFINAYEEHVPKKLKDKITIVLVTISDNQKDRERAADNALIADFSQKPLSDAIFKKLIKKHFDVPF